MFFYRQCCNTTILYTRDQLQFFNKYCQQILLTFVFVNTIQLQNMLIFKGIKKKLY